MNKIFIVLSLCGLLVGCAAIKQGISDYKLGKDTALVNGETSPSEQTQPIVSTASAIPVVGPFAGVLGIVLTGFFTWQRGVSIRKNSGIVPATSPNNINMFSTIIQDVANIASGIFTTTSTDSPSTTSSVVQRVWKVALSVVASGTALAIANPSLQTYLVAHPVLSSLFVGISSGIAGIEKALSSVQPISTTPKATA